MAEFDLAIKGKRDLEERIKELEGKVQNSTEDLRRAKEEKDRLIAELKKEIEKKEEIKVIAKDKGDLERKVGILEKDIAGKTEELKKVTKEKEKMGRELVEIKDKLAKLEGDCKEAERTRVQLIEREKEIEGLKAGIEKQQEERKRLTTEMEGLKGEKEKILTELNKAIEKARVMEEEMERLRISQEERQKEITLLKNRIAELSKREVEVAKERDIAKNEVLELQKKIKEMETNIDKIAEERDRLRLLLSEEKRKIDEVSSQIAILRQREKELLDLNATIKGVMEGRLLEIGQKLQVCERDVVSLQNERISRETASEELKRSVESLNAEVLRLRGFESEARNFQAESNRYIERINELERLIENSKKEDAGLRSELMKRDEEISRLIRDKKDLEKNLSELKDKVKGQGYKTLVIGDEKISPNHISSYMFRSQLTLGRLGIKEIPWRKGDLYEDFIGEHILYEEAKRINLKGKDNEGFNKLSLSKEDMEYLNRFNLITNLINHEIRKLSPERSAEAVVLRYSDDDRNEKAAMVVDVQNQIKAGLSVKDVVRSFSKSEYMTFSDKDINELFGDLSGYFSDNEVASTFNKDRFIVLKIKIRPLEYRPYESPSEDTIRMLREYVSMLIATLRSKRDVRFSD